MGRGTWAWVSAAALGAIAVGCGGIGPQPPAGPAPLLLSQIAPTSGPVTGGTTVTLTGLYFQGGAAIAIGGSAAGSVVVVSTASITAVTTPGVSGPASVVVTNPDGGSATLYGAFTYLATPAVTAISPSTGDVSGGTPVTITGTGFSSGATVLLGSSLATAVNVVSATTVTCLTPAGSAGAVNVTVTNPSALSATIVNGFTYATGGTVPTVSGVSPATGPSAGGTLVTLTGSSFVTGAAVTIGGAAATSVTFVSSTTLTAVTPRAPVGTAGALAVTATNSGGGSGSLSAAFTYTTTPVETITDTAADPDVAVDGSGRIHVVWQRTTSTSAEDILYARSTDGGLTWTPTPVNLEGSTNLVSRPRVAARGNTVFAVWNENIGFNEDVRSTYSTDGGATWSAPASLATNTSGLPDPDVALDANGAVVVVFAVFVGVSPSGWPITEIHAVRGTAGGSFSSPVVVGGTLASGPSVAADGNGLVVVAWEDFPAAAVANQGLDVWVARSADGGATWGGVRNCTNAGGNGINSHSPAVALAGTAAVLSWAAEWPVGSLANYRIRATGSTDGGVTWSAFPVDVSAAMQPAYPAPAVAADGNGTFTVAWFENLVSPANAEIFSARTTDAGQSFSTPVNLSSNSGTSFQPALAGGTGSFLIHVWADDTAWSGRADVLSY